MTTATTTTDRDARIAARHISLVNVANNLLSANLSACPAVAADKFPTGVSWGEFQQRRMGLSEVAKFFHGADAICIICGAVSGDLEVLDFDDRGSRYEAWRHKIAGVNPALMDSLVVEQSPSGGFHVYARVPGAVEGSQKLAVRRQYVDGPEETMINGKGYKPKQDEDGRWYVIIVLIETKGEGGLIVCDPTPGYRLVQGSLLAIPEITAEQRQFLLDTARAFDETPKPVAASKPSLTKPEGPPDDSTPWGDFNVRGDFRSVLQRAGWRKVRDPIPGDDNERWRRPGKEDGHSATINGNRVFFVFSGNAAPFEENKPYSPFQVYMLLEHNGDAKAAGRALAGLGYGKQNGRARRENPAPATVRLPLTDTGNAERFARDHGGEARYCFAWGKWLAWDNRRWAIDDMGHIEQWAKRTARGIYREASETGDVDERRAIVAFGKSSESAQRRAAMLSLARSEPPIPIRPEVLDQDGWLLNCPNGTLDLRTGKLRTHRQNDYITKLCPVDYFPDATAPTWEDFLRRILDCNEGIIRFVHRLAGYFLTGDTSEQLLPIFHGVGANGKSTLINAILEVLGVDYAMKAPPEMLLARKQDAHPTERADLFGKRFVAMVETDDGRRLAESIVKELTGGDRLRARRMREDFWEFAPTHKVVLACNHRPEVRGTDHAIWRRLRLVPFNVVIPDHHQDKHLAEKLRRELPGILAWGVRGCLDWQAHGLSAPPEVEAATASYRADQDRLGDFINERCVVGPEFKTKAGTLYAAYKLWCQAAGEYAISQRRFGAQLGEREFTRFTNNGTWYAGIGLISEATEGSGALFPISS
jgi:putative DNA primase/helicase